MDLLTRLSPRWLEGDVSRPVGARGGGPQSELPLIDGREVPLIGSGQRQAVDAEYTPCKGLIVEPQAIMDAPVHRGYPRPRPVNYALIVSKAMGPDGHGRVTPDPVAGERMTQTLDRQGCPDNRGLVSR